MDLKKLLLLISLTGLIFAATSCGDYVGKEKSHPFFVKAETCRNAGNYKEAAQYFEEFLNVCPRSPAVHYELGSLYTDHLNNPYKAIYHYQRYLDLNRMSPDVESIRKFIESEKRKIFEQLSTLFESADTAKAYEEAAKTKKILDQYVEYSKKLRAQNDALRSQNDEMRKRIESFAKDSESFKKTVKDLQKKAQAAQLAAQEPVKPETPSTPEKQEAPKTDKPEETAKTPEQPKPETPAVIKDSGDKWENAKIAAQSKNAAAGEKNPQPTPEHRTHKVQKGDSLYRIAIKYYKTSAAIDWLREANVKILKGKDFLQIGQVLVLPPAPSAKGDKK